MKSQRILIVGTTCSGKSTFGKKLSLPSFQLIRRSLVQMQTQELFCNRNRQTLPQFFWLVKWTCISFKKRRRTYHSAQSPVSSLSLDHFKAQHEVDEFFSGNGYIDLVCDQIRE